MRKDDYSFSELRELWNNRINDSEKYYRLLNFLSNSKSTFSEVIVYKASIVTACNVCGVGYDNRVIQYAPFDSYGEYSSCSEIFTSIQHIQKNMSIYIPTLLMMINTLVYRNEESKKTMYDTIIDAFNNSLLDVTILSNGNSLYAIPKGSKLLDSVVSDNLGMLSKYKKSYEQFFTHVSTQIKDRVLTN